MLEHKIPPPVVTLVAIGGIYLSSQVSLMDALQISPIYSLGGVLVLLGFGIMLAGALEFRRAQTTVNPLNPEQASELVSSGIFKRTRNPMYLGMSLMVGAATLIVGHLSGLIWLIVFMLYIQVYQIHPEEKAMQKLFGDAFNQYRQQVRRWI
ncbi:MAG: methyltransferase family protein [Cellvibrionaceae bacterium]